MTREEIIDFCEMKSQLEPENEDIFNYIIKALEQEPLEVEAAELQKAYKKGFEDCRQAVLSLINDQKDVFYSEGDRSLFESYVSELSPVTPQPKTGHWIRWYEQKEDDWVVDNIPHCKCSECGTEYDPHSSQFIKYCNECGARMVEPQEREVKEC